MISQEQLNIWKADAPWTRSSQVEQDLVLSRAIVELFSQPVIANSLAFRGGTAIYKLFFRPPDRYSEDIDLVQMSPERIGPVMSAVRKALGPWLGKPKWKQTRRMVTIYYRYDSEYAEDQPSVEMRLKIEINICEHDSLYSLKSVPFSVESSWFEGNAMVTTFDLDEILASKFRALYQRKKGRDLFDLFIALNRKAIDPSRMISTFLYFIERDGGQISRSQFERNLTLKLREPEFENDMTRLLGIGQSWDIKAAAKQVSQELIELLPGDPWKGFES